MALQPNQRLGPYEILSAIGAGGMGEVYRARDTRLERTVAVKILPDHLSDRAELRERFEREARTVASLNHPHICTLHDIGHQDGTDFLVMEYLEGETLAERLKKGPLPLDQVPQYAIEISDALDKAHRKGITHRDLKPGNIMLTKSGTKLLDFGLAKLRQEAPPANLSLSKLPTANDAVTVQGAIVGTLRYMAPEQLEGREVDARTDIFAFGVVVYEMATGRKAFEGKSQASLIAKILETQPAPMPTLQPMTPPMLDHLVQRCLAKDPDERWQSARDLEVQLKWIAAGGSQVAGPGPAVSSTRKNLRRLIWVALGLAACAVFGLNVWRLRQVPSVPPRSVTRFTISLPPGQRLTGLDVPEIALSPDGNRLAYVAAQGNGLPQLYLRPMDSAEAKPIPGTEGATNPFFSPDSQWVGFFAGRKLKKVPASGGAAVIVADTTQTRGASWGSQGMIIFGNEEAAVLMQVADGGGTPHPLTHLEKGETDQDWPEFLPGDKTMLFAASGRDRGNGVVAVQTIGTGERRNLIQGTNPHYAPSGQLVYAQDGNLMAVPFDAQKLAITGAAVSVAEGVLQSTSRGGAQYSISGTGSLVYVTGAAAATEQRSLVWVSRNGAEQPLPTPAHDQQMPRISPDGRRLAITIDEDESQVWLYDLSRNTLARLTFNGNENGNQTWAPDGKHIAFSEEESADIFWQLADGSGGQEHLIDGGFPSSWSRDGQLLAFMKRNADNRNEIWVLRMSDRKAQPFLRTAFNNIAAQFSPDGHWLAYVSDESGRDEVYVRPYPGPGGKYPISTQGGTGPVWNPNGKELFYRSGDKMMAVEITTQPGFDAGSPRMLFERRYETTGVPQLANYDVSPDGQRFLMLKAKEQESAPTQINVVLNWFEELTQKVPAGKK